MILVGSLPDRYPGLTGSLQMRSDGRMVNRRSNMVHAVYIDLRTVRGKEQPIARKYL